MRTGWAEVRNAEAQEDRLWELYHENSCIERHSRGLANSEVLQKMSEMHESMQFDGAPRFDLPRANADGFSALITRRRTATSQTLRPRPLALDAVSRLLFAAGGVTQAAGDGLFPRAFRSAPSAGALFPIDIFLFSTHFEGLAAGLYHFHPVSHTVALIEEGDVSAALARGLVQPELARNAAVLMFLVATFERATFKYGERGYRFALIESGHIAQNLLLAATDLGLAGIPIGGFLDRELNDALSLDGTTQAVVYGIALGERSEASLDR